MPLPFTFPGAANDQTKTSRIERERGENKLVCLLEGKPGADPVADGSSSTPAPYRSPRSDFYWS